MRFRGLTYLLCFLGGELVLTDFRCLQEGCFRHAHTGQTPWVSDARMHCNNLITFSLKATERKHAKYDTLSKPFLLIKGHKNWEYIPGADFRQLEINYRTTLVRFILTLIWKYIFHAPTGYRDLFRNLWNKISALAEWAGHCSHPRRKLRK